MDGTATPWRTSEPLCRYWHPHLKYWGRKRWGILQYKQSYPQETGRRRRNLWACLRPGNGPNIWQDQVDIESPHLSRTHWTNEMKFAIGTSDNRIFKWDMQLLLPGEFFWTHLPGHMLFFIMSPQAVVVSAFYSKILLVFYVQGLSQESPMFAQQVTCF